MSKNKEIKIQKLQLHLLLCMSVKIEVLPKLRTRETDGLRKSVLNGIRIWNQVGRSNHNLKNTK